MKRFLYHLKRGKLTFIGKPLFIILVTVELLWERMMDMIFALEFDTQGVDENLTAVIKTFERPKELKRLIESIKRFYPNMKIIVVDDSREATFIDGVYTIVMPYNTGISAGRNQAMKEITTKYVLLLDDDFVFYRKTDFCDAVKCMETYGEIDIMGGAVVNLPLYIVNNYSNAKLFPGANKNRTVEESHIGELPVYDKVANFFIARVERLKIVTWDEELKKIEHNDFFTRAKGVLTTVYNPSFKVLHAQTPFNKLYMEKRNDISVERKVLEKKYYSDS